MGLETLATKAEFLAQAAEEFPAFSGTKLLHIKRQIAELLSLIGRGGVFDQYTKHDISHIDSMLKSLDWIVPPDTLELLTAADWLMIVLSIYFHDLGLLVTHEEFQNRHASGYPDFRDQVLFGGREGLDYKSKIQALAPDEADRFLYQEFVRQRHAERIRDWIIGRATEHLGRSHAVVSEIEDLLRSLHPQFRRDLALVCESHHLEDLTDLKKYRISQPYGNSINETCNIQYCALLLRTADLLHITGNRTPSVLFRVINPTDPVSQLEWVKQMAVTSVRAKLGTDREGRPSAEAPRDTIEVHAYFTDAMGFFGLSSYLTYAQEQLRRSNEWARLAGKQSGARHRLPWRFIDDQGIEAAGFLRQQFEFTIDQAKILDLLTGHTLYNDTQVVVRELAQNSLDAIRLQRLLDSRNGRPETSGLINITWEPGSRILEIQDNGTGMTQDIIEKHLLKVGASRYQDPDLKRQFPMFSPISRFGIGLLSVFMIADDVEIITVHPEDAEARQLSLRSVHGKYLIRLHDKGSETVKEIGPHGTLVRLRVRQAAEITDIVATCKKWIVVPQCDVYARVGSAPPVKIGYASPRAVLADLANSKESSSRPRKVEEMELDGVTLAYLLEWSEFFREWTFVRYSGSGEGYGRHEGPVGVCVEGVRVEFDSPGFREDGIVALANAVGLQAPKTNVARSGLEMTPERDALLRAVYNMYCDHIVREMRDLWETRKYSLTWATQEVRFLAFPLADLRMAVNSSILKQMLEKIPALLIERHGRREAIAAEDLRHETAFWTLDSAFFRSMELLMREVPGSGSVSGVVQGLQLEGVKLPNETILCGYSASSFTKPVFSAFEVDIVRVDRMQRRIDLRWVARGDSSRWVDLDLRKMAEANREAAALLDTLLRRTALRDLERISIGSSLDVKVSGVNDEIAVRSQGQLFLLPGTPAAQYLLQLMKVDEEELLRVKAFIAAVVALVSSVKGRVTEGLDTTIASLLKVLKTSEVIDREEVIRQLAGENWRIFDTADWSRSWSIE